MNKLLFYIIYPYYFPCGFSLRKFEIVKVLVIAGKADLLHFDFCFCIFVYVLFQNFTQGRRYYILFAILL